MQKVAACPEDCCNDSRWQAKKKGHKGRLWCRSQSVAELPMCSNVWLAKWSVNMVLGRWKEPHMWMSCLPFRKEIDESRGRYLPTDLQEPEAQPGWVASPWEGDLCLGDASECPQCCCSRAGKGVNAGSGNNPECHSSLSPQGQHISHDSGLRHNLDGLQHEEKEIFVWEMQASVLDASVHQVNTFCMIQAWGITWMGCGMKRRRSLSGRHKRVSLMLLFMGWQGCQCWKWLQSWVSFITQSARSTHFAWFRPEAQPGWVAAWREGDLCLGDASKCPRCLSPPGQHISHDSGLRHNLDWGMMRRRSLSGRCKQVSSMPQSTGSTHFTWFRPEAQPGLRHDEKEIFVWETQASVLDASVHRVNTFHMIQAWGTTWIEAWWERDLCLGDASKCPWCLSPPGQHISHDSGLSYNLDWGMMRKRSLSGRCKQVSLMPQSTRSTHFAWFRPEVQPGLRHDEKEIFVWETQALSTWAAVHGLVWCVNAGSGDNPGHQPILSLLGRDILHDPGQLERFVCRTRGPCPDNNVPGQPGTSTRWQLQPWWVFFATSTTATSLSPNPTSGWSKPWPNPDHHQHGHPLPENEPLNYIWSAFEEWNAFFIQCLVNDKDVNEDAIHETLILSAGCHMMDTASAMWWCWTHDGPSQKKKGHQEGLDWIALNLILNKLIIMKIRNIKEY